MVFGAQIDLSLVIKGIVDVLIHCDEPVFLPLLLLTGEYAFVEEFVVLACVESVILDARLAHLVISLASLEILVLDLGVCSGEIVFWPVKSLLN